MGSIYAANLLDKPVAIDGPPAKKQRKPRKAESVEPEDEAPPPPPTKKPKTEAQLAALAAAREKRAANKAAADAAAAAEATAAKVAANDKMLADAAAIEAKQAQLEKRRQAAAARRAEKKAKQLESISEVDESTDGSTLDAAVTEAMKDADEEPPKWFKQYVQGVKKEEAKLSSEKKPKKQVQFEAKEHAQAAWKDAPTRERVLHEAGNHMSRMYHTIFPGRSF